MQLTLSQQAEPLSPCFPNPQPALILDDVKYKKMQIQNCNYKFWGALCNWSQISSLRWTLQINCKYIREDLLSRNSNCGRSMCKYSDFDNLLMTVCKAVCALGRAYLCSLYWYSFRAIVSSPSREVLTPPNSVSLLQQQPNLPANRISGHWGVSSPFGNLDFADYSPGEKFSSSSIEQQRLASE